MTGILGGLSGLKLGVERVGQLGLPPIGGGSPSSPTSSQAPFTLYLSQK